MASKKIILFLVDGLPKGLRSASIDQWNGRVVAGPRNKISETITLFEKTGGGSCIYFLIGESDEGGLPLVYVGESDQIISRIKQHDKNKDWWRSIVIFFTPDNSLTTTGSQYLEAICIKGLQLAGRCILKNSTNPNLREIPLEDVSGLQYFFKNIVLLLPLLGYDVLVGDTHKEKIGENIIFFLTRKGIKAKAFLREDGQLQVLKGSTAVLKTTPSFEKHPYKSLRDDLIKIGKLVRQKDGYRFVDDYIFNSSSAAGAVVLGNSTNGPLAWKNKNKKTLKEIIN